MSGNAGSKFPPVAIHEVPQVNIGHAPYDILLIVPGPRPLDSPGDARDVIRRGLEGYFCSAVRRVMTQKGMWIEGIDSQLTKSHVVRLTLLLMDNL